MKKIGKVINFIIITTIIVLLFNTCEQSTDEIPNPPIIVSGTNWNEKMLWLFTNAQSGNEYIIELHSDECIELTHFSFIGKKNIKITLKGIGATRIISLNTRGPLFIVGSGSGNVNSFTEVTLNLEKNLELRGINNNYTPLIIVYSGSNLILNDNVKIIKNTNTATSMPSGGGGIFVTINSSFTMNGGEISENTLSTSVGYSSDLMGGGVSVSGIFIMNGGIISKNNSASSASPTAKGGGVSVSVSGTFIMNDGEISGNSSSSSGSSYGGGIFIAGTFIMNGGIISGNTAAGSAANGGGIYINRSIFNKTHGIIFGYTEGDINSNVVKNTSGIIQQNRGHAIHVEHENSIYIMRKNTTSDLTQSLYFNGNTNPPVWSGDWDY